MSPGLLLLLLAVCLLALLPVWRLRIAGWPPRWLLTAWLLYAAGIFAVVRFAVGARFMIPILVLAFVAPFVAGPERLARVLGGRRPRRRTIIDVTPKPAPGLPDPAEDEAADAEPRTGPGDG